MIFNIFKLNTRSVEKLNKATSILIYVIVLLTYFKLRLFDKTH